MKQPQKEKKSEFEDVKKKFRNDDLCLKFLDDQVFCFDYAKISEMTAKEIGVWLSQAFHIVHMIFPIFLYIE